MSRSTRTPFQTIRSEGGLLPADLLQRVAQRDGGLGGLRPDDYHLTDLPLNEAIVRSWSRLVAAWARLREARAALAEDDPGTTVTRERWLLVLFEELRYGRLQAARAVEIGGGRIRSRTPGARSRSTSSAARCRWIGGPRGSLAPLPTPRTGLCRSS